MISAKSLAHLRSSIFRDYDSDMDADYSPSEESSSEDDLEFCTDADESTGAEESDTA